MLFVRGIISRDGEETFGEVKIVNDVDRCNGRLFGRMVLAGGNIVLVFQCSDGSLVGEMR